MTKSEEDRMEEYAKGVPEFYRGAWLIDWDKKCPCHVAAFNCAEHYCSDKRQSKKEQKA